MLKQFSGLVLAIAATLSASSPALAVPDVYPTPGVESTTGGLFSAAISGTLYGYYTGAAGGFTNLAGARINGVDTLTGLNNQTSAYGDRFNFGTVNPGDSLIFFIDVLDTGRRFYSDPALNFDRVNHTWTKVYGGDSFVPAGFNLAFEDLDFGGDFNYFDHSFVIGIDQASVPEPDSWALLIVGFGVAGISMRYRVRVKASANA
jgi:hypothetical protein